MLQKQQANTVLTSRLQTGSTKPQTAKALKILNQQIDSSISYVKGYIVDKYKKDVAPSYYASFGIEHIGERYVLPADQNKRLAALGLMVTAIAAQGFGTKEYGTTFWTTIKTNYAALLATANTTDSTILVKVGDKNVLKRDLKKGLNALVNVIKANYPDTYKAELRNWGFQKEKY